jgi:hydrophobic/amphiphilic exporter-1 (mainly G- bacteria), HAE1 family
MVSRSALRPGQSVEAVADSRAEPGASLVPLGSVIRIDEEKSASRIDRIDRQRVASLHAGVAPGYALADRLEALRGQ